MAFGCERSKCQREKGGTVKPRSVQIEAKAVGVDTPARTVTGWASIKEADRGGDLMLPSAFEKWLPRFKTNPIMCWCHDLHGLPIGRIIDISIEEGGLKFTAKFATIKFAQEVFTLFKEKVLRAFSVQFLPHVTRDPNEDEKATFGETLGRVLEEVELLEISPVTVPAVANALTSKGFDPLTGEETDDTPPPPKKNIRETLTVAQELVTQLGEVITAALEAAPAEEEPPPEETPPPEEEPVSDEDQASLARILEIGKSINAELVPAGSGSATQEA
jgi:HK97 family phage prohead protease